MNKLYLRLHNTHTNLKKQFFPLGLLLFLTLYSGSYANAQCIPPPAPVVTPASVLMCLGDPPVKLKIVPAAATNQFCSGPVNISVPDNNAAGSSNSITVATVPSGCVVTSMMVTINMTHTRVGDMVFVLRAPNGQILNLDYRLTATGGSGPGTGFVNLIISSSATIALSTGTSPYTGTFKADAQLVAIGGLGAPGPTGMQPTSANWNNLFAVPNGNWTLGFYDAASSETGTLTSWCLGFTYTCSTGTATTPAIWSPIAGLYTDPAATVPYLGTAIDSVWVRPIPAGIYTYQVTTQSLPAPPAAFTNPAAISIPVGGIATAYPSPVTVSGLPVTGVTVKSVILHGISHTNAEDLDIILQSPTGQNIILMSDVGGANAVNNTTYTFMDTGPAMSITSANATGTYRPTNNGTPDNFPAPGPGSFSQPNPAINMFTGNMNGLWRLFVVDDDGTTGQGVIAGGYTINFDTGSAPCNSPATAVVVTVGLPITVTTQPVNQNICAGNNAYFTVAASGTGLNYQWQVSSNGGGSFSNIVNAGVYSGATTATLTITSPPISMSGLRYRALISGPAACSTAISGIAILTINPTPVVLITAYPYTKLLPGLTTTLSSTVSPNAVSTYTWFLNGSVLPGANADTILVDFSGLGIYQLSVTDINGCTGVSNTIEIKDSAHGRIFIYPNPSTNGLFQLRLHSEANTAVPRTLIVYNNMGIRVMSKSFDQTIPYERIDVDVRKHGKGLYLVEVINKEGKRIGLSRVLVQ